MCSELPSNLSTLAWPSYGGLNAPLTYLIGQMDIKKGRKKKEKEKNEDLKKINVY